MTMTRQTPATHGTPPPPPVAGNLGERVLHEGRRACIDEILHGVVVSALGPGSRMAVSRDEWSRVEDAIRGPVADATTAALERLAAELQAVLPRRMPEVVTRLDAARQRAELGYE